MKVAAYYDLSAFAVYLPLGVLVVGALIVCLALLKTPDVESGAQAATRSIGGIKLPVSSHRAIRYCLVGSIVICMVAVVAAYPSVDQVNNWRIRKMLGLDVECKNVDELNQYLAATDGGFIPFSGVDPSELDEVEAVEATDTTVGDRDDGQPTK